MQVPPGDQVEVSQVSRCRYHLVPGGQSSPGPPERPVAVGVRDQAGEPEEEAEVPPVPPLQDLQMLRLYFELIIW